MRAALSGEGLGLGNIGHPTSSAGEKPETKECLAAFMRFGEKPGSGSSWNGRGRDHSPGLIGP